MCIGGGGGGRKEGKKRREEKKEREEKKGKKKRRGPRFNFGRVESLVGLLIADDDLQDEHDVRDVEQAVAVEIDCGENADWNTAAA